MKCTTVIDRTRDEEIVIYAHERTSLVGEIEALVERHTTDLIGYREHRGERQIVKLTPADVHCFVAEDDRVFALTDSEKLQIKARLYELEAALGTSFVRVNQSCLVNVRQIERFDASFAGALEVRLKNGHRDYVSRRQLKIVKERIGFTL